MPLSDEPTKKRLFKTLIIKALYIVINLLLLLDIKELSCTNTKLRGACLSFLFCCVELLFLKAGFNNLRPLLDLNA